MKPVADIAFGADGAIFAIGKADEVYYKAPPVPKWSLIAKLKLKVIAAGSSSNAWGLDDKGKVYRWNGASFSKVVDKQFLRLSANETQVNFSSSKYL